MDLELTGPDGAPIRDWRAWSAPKHSDHWQPGRSAMELARAWFTTGAPQCPPELISLFGSSLLLRDLAIKRGTPELVTPLPESGEGRNHDLVLDGTSVSGKVLIAVEAKADEEFGPSIGVYWSAKRESRARPDGKPSKAPERIEKLLSLLDSTARPDIDPWKQVRYQLLTAAVGTLFEARHRMAAVAVLVIHEFRTSATKAIGLNRNSADFAVFLSALGLAERSTVVPGRLYGPFQTSTDLPPLLVGKAVYDWTATSY